MTNSNETSTYITTVPFSLARHSALIKKAKDYGLVITENQQRHPELLAKAIEQHELLISEVSKLPTLAIENAKKYVKDDIWGIYELELLSKAAYYNIDVNLSDIDWHLLEDAVNAAGNVTNTADQYGISWEPYMLEIGEVKDLIEEYEANEYKSLKSHIADFYNSIRV